MWCLVPQLQSGTEPDLNSVFMVPKFFLFPGYHTLDTDGGKGGGCRAGRFLGPEEDLLGALDRTVPFRFCKPGIS